FLIITFASIAVPGTNGFVGEFLVLLGTFKSTEIPMWIAVLAATGVILGAAYMLWMVQRVFFGPLVQVENARLRDVNGRELAAAPPLGVVGVGGRPPPPSPPPARAPPPPAATGHGPRSGPTFRRATMRPGSPSFPPPPPSRWRRFPPASPPSARPPCSLCPR